MVKKFITKGQGAGRKVIPLSDKAKVKVKAKVRVKPRKLMRYPEDDEEFAPKVVKALTDKIGEIKVIEDEGSFWSVSAMDGKDYMLFEDVESAKDYAIDMVSENLYENPQMFDKKWLDSQKDKYGNIPHYEVAEDLIKKQGIAKYLASYDNKQINTATGHLLFRIM